MSSDEEPSSKKRKNVAIPPCPYGRKCYRKNPKHFKEYSHPESDSEEDAVEAGPSSKSTGTVQVDTTKLPPCPFGTKCYRKNLLHFAEYSHPFVSDGASTSAPVPDDDSGSDTDVYDSSEEQSIEKDDNDCKPTKSDESKDVILAKRYSLLTEAERKDLIQKALEMKKKLEQELEETKKTVAEKENAIKKMQDEMNKGVLLMDGEAEALEGDEMKYYTLIPERQYKEGSAAQVHFRLAESQFYRLLSGGYANSYKVNKVVYAVNPKLVKRFSEAREEMKKKRGEEYTHPILAFHGTEEKNIIPIVETGFRIPGIDDKKLVHRTGNEGYYGKGIYFSEYTHYSLAYVAGKNKIMLNKVLPGKIYDTPGLITGQALQDGYDSHMSPCKKELVVFHSARILPCYIVHYDTTGKEFKYKKAIEDRRKAKSKDDLMKLYWKSQKKAKSGVFAGLSILFCGTFADETGMLVALASKHGATAHWDRAAAPLPTRGRGRGRGKARAVPVTGYMFPLPTFQLLITSDEVFSQTTPHPIMAHATRFRASIVREEYLYDCIIQKKRLDTEDYEFD